MITSTIWQLFHLWQTSNIFVLRIVIKSQLSLSSWSSTSWSTHPPPLKYLQKLRLEFCDSILVPSASSEYFKTHHQPQQPEPDLSVNNPHHHPQLNATQPQHRNLARAELFLLRPRLHVLHLKVQSHPPDFFIYEIVYLYICIFIFILCVSVFGIWLLHL